MLGRCGGLSGRYGLVAFLLTALCVWLTLTGPALADEPFVGMDLIRPGVTVAEVSDYWTPERMAEANANSLDVVIPAPESDLSAQSIVPDGESDTAPRLAAPDVGPGPMTASAAPAAQACPVTGYATWSNGCGTEFPVRTVGKLFFSTTEGDFTCSAALVEDNLIITAAHCVSAYGAVYSNFIFIPGYLNGAEPHGRATGRKIYLFHAWTESQSMTRDVAFVSIEPAMGKQLGHLGVAVNMDHTAQVYAQYGYPTQHPYDGQKLWINSSLVGAATTIYGQPYPIGAGSSLTRGASGGPWIIGQSHVNGINSFTLSDCSTTVYSPYFDNSVYEMYRYAAADDL